MTSREERQVVQKCIRGNHRAQKKLYETYSPSMYALCLRYAKDQDQASEILQTGFIRVFENLNQFGFKGALGGWIRRVIVNNAISVVQFNKRYSVEEDIEEYIEDFTVESSNDVNLLLDEETIQSALITLKEEYRLIFNLHCIEDYSHKEIAILLDIKESTSRSKLRRAKEELRRKLQRYIDKKSS